MFCDACGAALQPGQGYCTRCSKQVIGPVVEGSGRVARHTQLLGILWIAYSVISGFGGIVLMIVGLIPLLAGAFDVCVISGLLGGPFRGAAIRQTAKR